MGSLPRSSSDWSPIRHHQERPFRSVASLMEELGKARDALAGREDSRRGRTAQEPDPDTVSSLTDGDLCRQRFGKASVADRMFRDCHRRGAAGSG